MNILDEVKTRLSITGTDLDGTIQGMIDDVISYCRSAGLKYTQIVSTRAVGLIARGVADLWNYGAGNGKFSDIFQLRLNQMTLDAASMEQDVELQEKSVTITENGMTRVTPDDGYVLSSVNVDVNVPSKPEQAKSVTITENGRTEITPDEGYLLTGVTVDTSVPGKTEQTKAVTIRENGVTEVMPDAGHVLTGVTVEANVPQPETQEKTIDISTNGTEIVTPDEGRLLSSVTVNTNVPSTPTQTKAVTIDANGTYLIEPDDGHVLSGVTATVNVQAATAEYNILAPSYEYTPYTGLQACITVVDMSSIVGIEKVSDLSYLFYNFKRLQTIHWGDKEFTASNISSMFAKCEALESVLLPKIIRSISSFTYMFDGCKKIKNIDLTSVSFSTPDSMASVFNGCKSLESVNLSTLDTRQVTSANSAFGNCTSLSNIIFSENLFPNKDFKDLNLSGAPLSHDCAVDIFNKLATRTNSPSLKLSATTKGYLTENEIAIATGKGWVVS